jgi:glycerol-3-phosphate dehydrogenase
MSSEGPAGGGEVFDVAVIGGGVVGCAVARRFTLEGARVVLLERAADILAGASKANSALLHTGFDAPPGSLELACMQAGYREYLEIRDRLNLPLLETGGLVVAWTDEELAKLDSIVAQAHGNGVADVVRLDRDQIRAREPHLSLKALGGVLVPGEHVIDPWSAPLAYLRQAVDNGARVWFGAEVLGGSLDHDVWTLDTRRGPIQAAMVINCAGLQGDLVNRALLGAADFTIHPRKGQFVVLDKAASRLVSAIILPVPSERTKGVLVTRTIFGNVLIGPTAEEQDDRDHATTVEDTLRTLIAKAADLLPALDGIPVTAAYAGLRPATERKEYRVGVDGERRWITVGGIRSTGLTAALGLARHVFALYGSIGLGHTPLTQPVWPFLPNLAEHLTRDWEQPDHGEIVCHCELVTRREIDDALNGPLPAGDLGGLKRRTRATMGRCQGFYCSARVAELTKDRLAEPLAVETSHG